MTTTIPYWANDYTVIFNGISVACRVELISNDATVEDIDGAFAEMSKQAKAKFTSIYPYRLDAEDTFKFQGRTQFRNCKE